MTAIQRLAGVFLLSALDWPAAAQAPSGIAVPVTVENFIRAETDMYFGGLAKQDSFGKFAHRREPANIDKQDVVRMNRETLYSQAVFDLDAGPVTITIPDAGMRFMSVMIVDQDHYVPGVFYGAGSHTLTKDKSARATSRRWCVRWSIPQIRRICSRSTRFRMR
jgi:hypothetical protein